MSTEARTPSFIIEFEKGKKNMKKILIIFSVINMMVFSIVFRKPKTKEYRTEYDCAIVCGYPANKDGTPSELMKTRVEKAVTLWEEGKVKKLILSGAAVGNEHIEAEIMKQYAIDRGIPEKYIILETKAVSTYHNMLYTKEIMKENELKHCIVVTNGWHLRKANHYARKFELDYVMAKAENPENEHLTMTLWRYISVNLHMYYMMFKGYY